MYNCWKPESVIRREAPELMARFIREYKQDKVTYVKLLGMFLAHLKKIFSHGAPNKINFAVGK